MNTTMTANRQQQNQRTGNQVSDANQAAGQSYRELFLPRFDIWEGDEEVVLYGDLPGVEPDSLDIQFKNRQLTVHGKVRRRCDGINCLHAEYEIGDFHRSFTIGEAIDSEAISAELTDGVLTLHLPKSPEVKPRRIEVKAE